VWHLTSAEECVMCSLCWFVALFVCLWKRLLKKLSTDYHETWWIAGALPWHELIRFWDRSASGSARNYQNKIWFDTVIAKTKTMQFVFIVSQCKIDFGIFFFSFVSDKLQYLLLLYCFFFVSTGIHIAIVVVVVVVIIIINNKISLVKRINRQETACSMTK